MMGSEFTLPEIRRARGYRLYGVDGRRYLDCWQCGGRTILGHRPPGLVGRLKNVLSTGLVGDLPSVYENRLVERLRRLIPSHPWVVLTNSTRRALALAAEHTGWDGTEEEVADPARGWAGRGPLESGVSLWRPFVDVGPATGAEAIIPVLPFGVGDAPAAVCFRHEVAAAQDTVSPAVLAGACLALDCLPRYSPGALAGDRRLVRLDAWQVESVYITPRFDPALYPGVFEEFLRGGVVLSPWPLVPSILPAEVSDGEAAAVVGLFASNP